MLQGPASPLDAAEGPRGSALIGAYQPRSRVSQSLAWLSEPLIGPPVCDDAMAARAASRIFCVIVAGVSIWEPVLPYIASTRHCLSTRLYSLCTLHSLYILHTSSAISANMPSLHNSSEAGSFSSGPPAASHGYKKSLSSKADPNTALSEDPNRMQYPGP